MSKYLKTKNQLSSSNSAYLASSDAAKESVGIASSRSTQQHNNEYSQQDLNLFEQLSQFDQQAASIKLPTRTASTAHQAYTTQDIEHFSRLVIATDTHSAIADCDNLPIDDQPSIGSPLSWKDSQPSDAT